MTKEACSKLVGIAPDGAAANVAGDLLKELVERELEWIFGMCCLAHRLELAIKDAFRGTSLYLLGEMLLGKSYFESHYQEYCTCVTARIRTYVQGSPGLIFSSFETSLC